MSGSNLEDSPTTGAQAPLIPPRVTECGKSCGKSVLESCADVFTPFQLKELSDRGKRHMGWYGLVILGWIVVITAMNLYALVKSGEENPILLFNLLLPFVVSTLAITKFIAGVLHSWCPWFQ